MNPDVNRIRVLSCAGEFYHRVGLTRLTICHTPVIINGAPHPPHTAHMAYYRRLLMGIIRSYRHDITVGNPFMPIIYYNDMIWAYPVYPSIPSTYGRLYPPISIIYTLNIPPIGGVPKHDKTFVKNDKTTF
jgi:hypothetical protein